MFSARTLSIRPSSPVVRRETLLTLVSAWLVEIEPLWIGGLALLIVLLAGGLHPMGTPLFASGHALPNSQGIAGLLIAKRHDWLTYILLGTVYPALLILSLSMRCWKAGEPAMKIARTMLALFCIGVFCAYLLRCGSVDNASILLVPVGLTVGLLGFTSIAKDRTGGSAKVVWALTVLCMLILAWTLSIQFMWWDRDSYGLPGLLGRIQALHSVVWAHPIYLPGGIACALLLTVGAHLLHRQFGAKFGQNKVSRAAALLLIGMLTLLGICQSGMIVPIALCFGLVIANVYAEPVSDTGAHPILFHIGNGVAVLILALASLRADRLFIQGISYHHWGVLVGPAAMVQQGGWLLWDVPTQYGFLSTLTLAYVPARTVWQSLYILDSCLLFCSALFLFAVLRSLRTGRLNLCFALFLTFAAVFLMPGFGSTQTGPQTFPSVGAYRFIWCYVLLACLLWEYRGVPENRTQTKILWLGCIAWLLGTLWSSESAVYCAVIWLPAYVLMLLRRAQRTYQTEPDRAHCVRGLLALLGVPPALLAATLGVICAYYHVRLGHGPDWMAFSDYARAFQAGFGSITVDHFGIVWLLLLVFCAMTTITVYLLRESLYHPALSLMVACCGAVWATSSYFIGRSHPQNVLNLTPIFCTAIAISLIVLTRHRRPDAWVALVRLSFVPVLAVVLIGALDNPQALSNSILALAHGYDRNVDCHLPVLDPAAMQLFAQAHVRAGDPILTTDLDLVPAWPPGVGATDSPPVMPTAWLPTEPFALFNPLPQARRDVYIARFVDRVRRNGWILEPEKKPDASELAFGGTSWIKDVLRRTHTATRGFQNADYRLTWYEVKPALQSHASPALESALLHAGRSSGLPVRSP